MTNLKIDLSTDNLQQLLNHAAPGPWTFLEEEEWEHVAGLEYLPTLTFIAHGVKDSNGKYLFGNYNDTILEEYPGNLQLAAHAFALAEEVLRMRRELQSMHNAWLNMAKDPNHIPAGQNLAEHVIDYIQTVLIASTHKKENAISDLSTDNLQQLLDQATPGPWVFVEDIADNLSGTQEIGHVVYAQRNELGDCLFGIWDDPVTDNYPTNLPLAARGPELAQEVIRLRGHIEGLITAMEEKAAAGQSASPEAIAGYLKDIVLKETE